MPLSNICFFFLFLASAVSWDFVSIGGRYPVHQSPAVSQFCVSNKLNSLRVAGTLPDLPVTLSFFGTAVLNSEIFVAGGLDANGVPSSAVFKLNCDGWSQVSSLAVARSGLSLVVLQNFLYAIGGTDGTMPLDIVERYDAGTCVWSLVAPMVQPRSNFGSAVRDSLIYVLGGASVMNSSMLINDAPLVDCKPLSQVEVYDPTLDQWTITTNMPTPRCRFAAVTFNGVILSVGGMDTNKISAAVEYLYPNMTWASASSLQDGIMDHALVATTNASFVFNGRNQLSGLPPGMTAYVAIWTPQTERWGWAAFYTPTAKCGHGVVSMSWMCSDATRQCGYCPDRFCDPGFTGSCPWSNCSGMQHCVNGSCINITASTGLSMNTFSTGVSMNSFSTGVNANSFSTGLVVPGLATTRLSSSFTIMSDSVVAQQSSVSLAPGPLAGVVLAAVVVASAVVAAVVVLVYRHQRARQTLIREDNMELEAQHLGDSLEKLGRSCDFNADQGDALAASWFIDYGSLEIEKVLGSGAFGIANKAKWRGTDCVVKTAQYNDEKARAAFMKEFSAMKRLRPHPNVVLLLGMSENPLAIVLEWVDGGSLDAMLNNWAILVTAEMAMQLCIDIAAGMRHLHEENILHCDLSARNVLISKRTNGYIAKIADFGLSHFAPDAEGIYASNSQLRLPIRWAAPENLDSQHVQSKAGDVWSFGVVVWEILEREQPYNEYATNQQVVHAILRGERLKQPTRILYPSILDTAMDMCFTNLPDQRPSFVELHKLLMSSADPESSDGESAMATSHDEHDPYLARGAFDSDADSTSNIRSSADNANPYSQSVLLEASDESDDDGVPLTRNRSLRYDDPVSLTNSRACSQIDDLPSHIDELSIDASHTDEFPIDTSHYTEELK
eukprot:TRINITY_DN176_c0_g1_i9.p1 TRINITY_DN176_c0_g1~~TRINITY_DN176_c0_g1_i9.p1  ORF type:complete len:895 (-),score=-46.15 TRINITY_DN176_c0_g1_i9:189-2873(-)